MIRSHFFYNQIQAYVKLYSMQNQKQPPQTTNNQPDPQSSDSELSSVHSQQLQDFLLTLKKFKRIQKDKKLTAFKKSNQKANQAFHQMSSFFHITKIARDTHKKLTKEQRTRKRSLRFLSQINKQSVEKITNKPIDQQTQPIIADNQNQIHPSVNGAQILFVCHVCKQKHQKIHPFYGYLCPSCAQLNLSKRNQKANLQNLTALVTGARIKIGYEIALKLLRDGATVLATSRFANDALLRFKSQSDYNQWKCRLTIIQCDFLSQQQVDHLITYVKANVAKLDILINNAAQTIVRPKEFFIKEIQHEQLMIEDKEGNPSSAIIKSNNESFPFPSLLSNQIAIKPGDIDTQQLDEFGQPTDKRSVNSWSQPIQDISLLDCYTTQVINSIVPFHLISKLKQKMIGPTPSWIINVSSMEGVFNRFYKSPCHPHTNMAKAALNMITRTCSLSFAKEGIYMNSVDTGWVTNENPFKVVESMANKHLFKCPLDCVDGAMRVLDPIYAGVLRAEFPFGQFLKNYNKSPTW